MFQAEHPHRGMSWQQVSTEEGSGWLNDEGVLDDDGEEDGVLQY